MGNKMDFDMYKQILYSQLIINNLYCSTQNLNLEMRPTAEI